MFGTYLSGISIATFLLVLAAYSNASDDYATTKITMLEAKNFYFQKAHLQTLVTQVLQEASTDVIPGANAKTCIEKRVNAVQKLINLAGVLATYNIRTEIGFVSGNKCNCTSLSGSDKELLENNGEEPLMAVSQILTCTDNGLQIAKLGVNGAGAIVFTTKNPEAKIVVNDA